MRNATLILIVFTLVTSLPASAQPTSQQRNEASLQLLQAVGYAELQRTLIERVCRQTPNAAVRLPACTKISSIPDIAIEQMALPNFKRYIPHEETQAALIFWTSPEGSSISRKQLREIKEERRDLLTESDLVTLDRFNKSLPGQAMSRFAEDRTVAVEVLRAIGRYADLAPEKRTP